MGLSAAQTMIVRPPWVHHGKSRRKNALYALPTRENDFAIMSEAEIFDDVAAAKMLVNSSGAIENLSIMEVVDINGIAGKANAIAGSYRKPGA